MTNALLLGGILLTGSVLAATGSKGRFHYGPAPCVLRENGAALVSARGVKTSLSWNPAGRGSVPITRVSAPALE